MILPCYCCDQQDVSCLHANLIFGQPFAGHSLLSPKLAAACPDRLFTAVGSLLPSNVGIFIIVGRVNVLFIILIILITLLLLILLLPWQITLILN